MGPDDWASDEAWPTITKTMPPEPAAGYGDRIMPGGILLDEPDTPPALWGDGDDVLWAEGEALIICAPDGTGKTTLAGNLTRARLGIGDGNVLGLPVLQGNRNVLYLAMDRPRQARRALRRLFTEPDRKTLDAKLRIWQGPPPSDLAQQPELLAHLAQTADADTIIVDSLKDAALRLSEDATGSGWNRARQLAIATGAELIELHHPRKAQADNKKPSKLEDLYGSRWITSGAGSVISLWGEAGDLVVELTHLKAPATLAGPWQMRIDPAAGSVHLDHAVDLLEQIRRRPDGLTAEQAACLLSGAKNPSRSEVEKARRRLVKKTDEGVLYCRPGSRGAGNPATWFLTERSQTPKSRGHSVSGSTNANHNGSRDTPETANMQVSKSRPDADSNHAPLGDGKSRGGGDIYIPPRDFHPRPDPESWPEGSHGEDAQ